MLAIKKLAGVAPQVNLSERVTHTPLQVQIRLPTLALKPRQWYQWPHKKDLRPTKFKKKLCQR